MLAAPEILADDARSIAETIAHVPLFRDLPATVLTAIAEAASARGYQEGETIYALGQYDGSELLVVGGGHVKASSSDPTTGAMLFEDIRENDIFGLAQAICGAEDSVYAGMSLRAEKPSRIIAIDAESFRVIVAQRPSLTKSLMLHFARLLAGDSVRGSASETSPERRVYAALMEYVERDAVAAAWRIAKMPKHRELADRANVEEGLAAAAVAKLIQSGAARREYPGLVIDDMAQLNRLAS